MKQRAAVVDARKPELAPWAPSLFLALLAVATFAAGLGGGFVLDDNYAVTGHPVVQGTAPLLDAFRLTFWGNSLEATPPSFRPLTTLSFALDQRLLGGSAVVFHLSSLLWYVGLVLALWAFARRSIGQWPAFLATTFFVVMPVHVENVSSIVGRADTLGVLFSLLALIALSPMLLKGEARSPLRLVLAALAFAAALLSKESMAALPLVVALLARYRDRASARLLPLRTHLPSLVMAGVLGLYLVLRLAIQPGTFSHTEPDDVL
ncbi:MAG: glycosyltransferase family 39 protein, partial [Polyangiaceae bacterium]